MQLEINVQPGDPCLPPNPISPQPGMAVVSVCGRLFNEGGVLYQRGGIYSVPAVADIPPTLVAPFSGEAPTDPCRRYDLGGALVVADGIAADMLARPTSHQVLMAGVTGARVTTAIGGYLDGTAWGPVGSRPETDPFFAAKICSVAIAP